MPPPIPLSQDVVFYSGQWNREIEKLILNKLAIECWAGNWVHGKTEMNLHCLHNIWEEVSNETDFKVSFAEYEAKMKQWETRFYNFTWLLTKEGVEHDIETNNLEAPAPLWLEVARTRPNVLVYMEQGEYGWFYLRDLFPNAIEISDTNSLVYSVSSATASSRNESYSSYYLRRGAFSASISRGNSSVDQGSSGVEQNDPIPSKGLTSSSDGPSGSGFFPDVLYGPRDNA